MRLAWPAFAFGIATLVALLLRALLLTVLRRWADGWSALPQAIRLPSILWSIVLGLLVTDSNFFAPGIFLFGAPAEALAKIADAFSNFSL